VPSLTLGYGSVAISSWWFLMILTRHNKTIHHGLDTVDLWPRWTLVQKPTRIHLTTLKCYKTDNLVKFKVIISVIVIILAIFLQYRWTHFKDVHCTIPNFFFFFFATNGHFIPLIAQHNKVSHWDQTTPKEPSWRRKINPFLLNLQKINYWLIQESDDINPWRPEASFLKKDLKTAISSSRSPDKNKIKFCTFNYKILPLTTRRICTKSFAKVDCMDCEIIMFEVERKVFLPLCLAGLAEFDRLWCKMFELRNFGVLHHLNAHHVRYFCTKS
jgi:hypothetical protein